MAYVTADHFSTKSAPVLSEGLRKVLIYMAIGAFAAAVSIPLAIATSQSSNGALFEECYSEGCTTP
jgi:hypothetical protein